MHFPSRLILSVDLPNHAATLVSDSVLMVLNKPDFLRLENLGKGGTTRHMPEMRESFLDREDIRSSRRSLG